MKTFLRLCLSTTAWLAMPTYASDWGCQVLLCLSNPAGATAVKECVPPIKKLYRHLAKGRAFPSCTFADGSDSAAGGHYARRSYSHYDLCPAGTTALPRQQLATTTAAAAAMQQNGIQRVALRRLALVSGIGQGDGMTNQSDSRAGNQALPNKICVAGARGTVPVSVMVQGTRGGTESRLMQAALYDQIVVLPPHPSSRVIDVHIDHVLQQRMRW
jgi:hypothetical protein